MTEEQSIQKGFNAGYKLKQLNPELSKTLQQGFKDNEHPYAKGFISGGKEYVKEMELSKSKETTKGWKPRKPLKPKQSKNKGKNFGGVVQSSPIVSFYSEHKTLWIIPFFFFKKS